MVYTTSLYSATNFRFKSLAEAEAQAKAAVRMRPTLYADLPEVVYECGENGIFPICEWSRHADH